MPIDSNWNDLKYFLAVHRTGTLAAAARATRVDQTTVARRIAALERDLGARILDRTPDGLALTGVGERILSAAEDVERAALTLERVAGGEDARIAGHVRLATTEALAYGYLLDRVATLRHRHPAIELELLAGAQRVDLARREAEVALRARPVNAKPDQPDLVGRRLLLLGWGIYASREYVARNGEPAPGSFAGHDVIAYDEGLAPIPGADYVAARAPEARSVFRCSSVLTMHAAARGQLGIAVLPCFLGGSDGSLVRLPPRDAIAPAELWCVCHEDMRATARVRAVMDWIADTLAGDAALITG